MMNIDSTAGFVCGECGAWVNFGTPHTHPIVVKSDASLDWLTESYIRLGQFRDKMTPEDVKAVQDFIERAAQWER